MAFLLELQLKTEKFATTVQGLKTKAKADAMITALQSTMLLTPDWPKIAFYPLTLPREVVQFVRRLTPSAS